MPWIYDLKWFIIRIENLKTGKKVVRMEYYCIVFSVVVLFKVLEWMWLVWKLFLLVCGDDGALLPIVWVNASREQNRTTTDYDCVDIYLIVWLFSLYSSCNTKHIDETVMCIFQFFAHVCIWMFRLFLFKSMYVFSSMHVQNVCFSI